MQTLLALMNVNVQQDMLVLDVNYVIHHVNHPLVKILVSVHQIVIQLDTRKIPVCFFSLFLFVIKFQVYLRTGIQWNKLSNSS